MSPLRAVPSESPLAAELTRDLGQFLVQRGWLTPEDLHQAIEQQHKSGGHLGTSLLEAGLITEDRLLDALSQVLGVPAAFARDLRDIPRTAWGLLPAKVALRHQAIPFRIVGGELWVAMQEVNDLAAHDEIAAVTGRRLRPHIALEPRVAEALSLYHQTSCPARFTRLLTRLDIKPNLWGVSRSATVLPAPPTSPAPPAAPAAAAGAAQAAEGAAPPERAPARPRSIPLTAEERAHLTPAAARQAARAAPARKQRPADTREPLSDREWAVLESRLHQAGSLDDIGEAVLAVLADRYRRGVLLKVQGEQIVGWIGRGPGIDEGALAAFTAGFDQPSIFLNLDHGVEFHLGPLPEMEVHKRLAECWGGSLPGHALVMPVRVRERLVAFLYGDRPRAEPAAVDLAEMRRLAGACAAAFELFLVRRKLRKA